MKKIIFNAFINNKFSELRRTAFVKLKVVLDNFPHTANKVNSWLVNAINITADKDPILKSAYLRRSRILCDCLSRNDIVLYFIFLPVLFFGSLVITCQHYNDKEKLSATKKEMVFASPPIINIASNAVNIKQFNPVINAPSSPTAVNQQKRSIVSQNPIEYVSLTIHHSIFASGKRAGLAPKIISQFMGIFSSTVNFARDVHDGDRVMLLYKKTPALVTNVTKVVRIGKKRKVISQVKKISENPQEILAAELVAHNKVYRAVRFTDATGRTDYYTPSGVTLNSVFLRSPVNYTHIGDRFSMHRWHPILHLYRAHLGVDFCAPTGTPLKAAANGKIASMGYMGGYGNAVLIKHDNRYSTFYAHLSHFAKNLHVGSPVSQNQLIGYVGMTGLATGPHVHYEFRVYGMQHDPLAVKLPHRALSDRVSRTKFFTLAKTLLARLDNHLPQYATQDKDLLDQQAIHA